MQTPALLALFATILAPMAVLSAPYAPEPSSGGHLGYRGHHGANSWGTTTTRLSPDLELASRVSEYIAHQRTGSPSSRSTETRGLTSRGSSIVGSETTTTGMSASQDAIATLVPGQHANLTTTVEGGAVVVATSKGNPTAY